MIDTRLVSLKLGRRAPVLDIQLWLNENLYICTRYFLYVKGWLRCIVSFSTHMQWRIQEADDVYAHFGAIE